jgi:hypothetical protein
MTQETDEYLQLLDDIRDVGILIAALRHEKKPDDPAEKVSAARRNEIDAHVRILEVMEKHLNARKTYFIALVMLAAADVPKPAFDAAATKPVGDRVRALAEELRVDLRGELTPWMAGI